MAVSVKTIIIGHNEWDTLTKPLMESIWEHEPLAQITVVDNASRPEYPQNQRYTLAWADNESVAKAINAGVRAAGFAEWYLILDNDVRCTGPFMLLPELFEDREIVGAEMRCWKYFDYLIGWCTFIPRRAWAEVGEMDEGYVHWGYQEVDWLYRAVQKGYRQVELITLPFQHMGHGSIHYVQDIDYWRAVNQRRFREKHGL